MSGVFFSVGIGWSPELVGWGAPGREPTREMLGCWRGKLDGKRGRLTDDQRTKQTLNVWNFPGVYALYRGDALIYVGQGQPIGDRLLAHHRADGLVGRWDSFSWFSVTPLVDSSGTLAAGAPIDPGAPITMQRLLDELEAFAIHVGGPMENRQLPDHGDDVWVLHQARSQYADPTMADLVKEVHQAVTEIREALKK